MPSPADPLAVFHSPVSHWFRTALGEPTIAQQKGWPSIVAGRSTLLLAPTGSGKTLAAFLVAINQLMFCPEPHKKDRCRILYVSPLKALATDIQRNLQTPIEGIAKVAGEQGIEFRKPTLAVRSGDTAASERAKIARTPPDILITTPESLYLMLTSNAREILPSIQTVIVDEIHTMVSTKRGSHLFVSLERLEALRGSANSPLQRIGLSATQRPLQEVARLLGGAELTGPDGSVVCPRPVEIIDAGNQKTWELRVEAGDLRLEAGDRRPETKQSTSGTSPKASSLRPPAYVERLVELIRAHRSTMIFANSRRLAERLAAAINDIAGEPIALAHHGAVAKDMRQNIEERLKRGELPAIVATSSLELGIDVGAVDLVIQIESPPSVASGLQRIGRSGHTVGAVSRGVIFPKYRGDLLACAAATTLMREGRVEASFCLHNPLDVLAQQMVAIASMDRVHVDDLFNLVRKAAPFADLSRGAFEGVLDMLCGRYPSDEFADLRPRLTWDRKTGVVRAREGAKQVAVINGGTIPDRGLYGVYLATGDGKSSKRVGELDEEMVFESQVGDVFLLGASSWRIEEITHDRVLVTPAPGEPGRMPFWRGDRPGRPVEFGRAIGQLARALAALPHDDACNRLRDTHALDEEAADNLVTYLHDQAKATSDVPSDTTVVVERSLDELGDHRICVMTPFGARVHAPWSIAIVAQLEAAGLSGINSVWSDDGIVLRIPNTEQPLPQVHFLPPPDEVENLVVQSLPQTSLFAAHFRENAARALLLPRRRPGQRAPLWITRKRAANLLTVASRYPSFPIVLETYRDCLRDVFDLPGLVDILRQIQSRAIRVIDLDVRTPSPFAASLLFSYVANFIYDGDAPVAERRAQLLSIDMEQLRELLGDSDIGKVLDPDVMVEVEQSLQRLDGERRVHSADGLHDMLLAIGDLRVDEIERRVADTSYVPSYLAQLKQEGRILQLHVSGEQRIVAMEDASRFRDALGVALPADLPPAFLSAVANPLDDLISRYARTHALFSVDDVAARFGLGVGPTRTSLEHLKHANRVLLVQHLADGHARHWCDIEVFRTIRRRSLAKLRKQVEPVEPAMLARFLHAWHGLAKPRAGSRALLATLTQLQGTPLIASTLESEVLAARIQDYHSSDLDLLCASGEVVWTGIEPVHPNDGRLTFYLAEQLGLLAPAPREVGGEYARQIRDLLATHGALFFSDLASSIGGFPVDLLQALWQLVWAGHVTNDTLAPLRSMMTAKRASRRASRDARSLLPGLRRPSLPGSEGRWSLLPHLRRPILSHAKIDAPSETERRTALAQVLLDRHGVLTREAVQAEGIAGGFSTIYEVLKAMEEAGRVRRGYFVAGLGATQFALPGADDRLRSMRQASMTPEVRIIAATDPANPYGSTLPWPDQDVATEVSAKPQRVAGAHVILINGAVAGYVGRTERSVRTFVSANEPTRSEHLMMIARALANLVEHGHRRTLLIREIDGVDAKQSRLAAHLISTGFTETSQGYFKRRTFVRAAGKSSSIA